MIIFKSILELGINETYFESVSIVLSLVCAISFVLLLVSIFTAMVSKNILLKPVILIFLYLFTLSMISIFSILFSTLFVFLGILFFITCIFLVIKISISVHEENKASGHIWYIFQK